MGLGHFEEVRYVNLRLPHRKAELGFAILGKVFDIAINEENIRTSNGSRATRLFSKRRCS